VNVPNAQLFTIATLTGHAVLTVGPYAIAIDNSVAHKEKIAESLRDAGSHLGDPFEVSILRREDFKVLTWFEVIYYSPDIIIILSLPQYKSVTTNFRNFRRHNGELFFF